MNRLSKILCIALLVRLLLPVGWSMVSPMKEGKKFSFSVSAVLDGSFYEQLDASFQNSYPLRDRILEQFLEFEEFWGLNRE